MWRTVRNGKVSGPAALIVPGNEPIVGVKSAGARDEVKSESGIRWIGSTPLSDPGCAKSAVARTMLEAQPPKLGVRQRVKLQP